MEKSTMPQSIERTIIFISEIVKRISNEKKRNYQKEKHRNQQLIKVAAEHQ